MTEQRLDSSAATHVPDTVRDDAPPAEATWNRAGEQNATYPAPPNEELLIGPAQLGTQALRSLEALLFASDIPLTPARAAELLQTDTSVVEAGVSELNRVYEESGRTFRVHKVAQGYQLYTLPEFASVVRKLYRRQYVQRLSGPALEVLAIVAYRQPVTRPEIEKLRGVDCAGPMVTLLERRLITTAGRAHRPGSPFLYRTTREFLRYFGLESLDALPPIEEVGAFLAEQEGTGTESLAQEYDARHLRRESEVRTAASGRPTPGANAGRAGDASVDSKEAAPTDSGGQD